MTGYHDAHSAGTYPWVPADDVPHARTWVSWPSRRGVRGLRLGGVQEDIALIARTIKRSGSGAAWLRRPGECRAPGALPEARRGPAAVLVRPGGRVLLVPGPGRSHHLP
ncbi:hypothetical protein ACFXAF_17230, partial [Kitasatospora sp. NPDC059463]